MEEQSSLGTNRLEAFSDGVFAIIMTLLILEVKVPEIHGAGNSEALIAFAAILPKLIAFAFSFVTLAIFWVNHHHFFHPMKKTDWRLLWHNNTLLFFLCIVPFTTAFIGEYPKIPAAVAAYAIVMACAALAFTLMAKYVFFESNLLDATVSKEKRKSELNRSIVAVVAYLVAALAAFVNIWFAWAIFFIVPIFYFVPTLMSGGSSKK